MRYNVDTSANSPVLEQDAEGAHSPDFLTPVNERREWLASAFSYDTRTVMSEQPSIAEGLVQDRREEWLSRHSSTHYGGDAKDAVYIPEQLVQARKQWVQEELLRDEEEQYQRQQQQDHGKQQQQQAMESRHPPAVLRQQGQRHAQRQRPTTIKSPTEVYFQQSQPRHNNIDSLLGIQPALSTAESEPSLSASLVEELERQVTLSSDPFDDEPFVPRATRGRSTARQQQQPPRNPQQIGYQPGRLQQPPVQPYIRHSMHHHHQVVMKPVVRQPSPTRSQHKAPGLSSSSSGGALADWAQQSAQTMARARMSVSGHADEELHTGGNNSPRGRSPYARQRYSPGSTPDSHIRPNSSHSTPPPANGSLTNVSPAVSSASSTRRSNLIIQGVKHRSNSRQSRNRLQASAEKMAHGSPPRRGRSLGYRREVTEPDEKTPFIAQALSSRSVSPGLDSGRRQQLQRNRRRRRRYRRQHSPTPALTTSRSSATMLGAPVQCTDFCVIL